MAVKDEVIPLFVADVTDAINDGSNGGNLGGATGIPALLLEEEDEEEVRSELDTVPLAAISEPVGPVELLVSELSRMLDDLFELEASKSSPSLMPLVDVEEVLQASIPELLAFVPALIPDVIDESRVEPERDDRLTNVLEGKCVLCDVLATFRPLPCPVSGDDQSDSESDAEEI